MSTINYLTVRNTIMPVVNAVTANYSTLRGSTLTGNALTTSTLATSTLTVSTMNFASTIISLGQSTNQTYNNFSNGSYAPISWITPKSDMTTANKTVQSANGLYQMIIGNTTSGLFLSSDSGITWSTLTGGLPTLTGSAYWSDGAISANGQYITLSIYGGSLWMSADYGRTFALTNQPTPNIWLPLNGNTTDLMGSSTVTATGSPAYVTLNYPGYTAQAVNLLNTAGGTATRYIRGTWSGSPNFTVSGWVNPQTVNGTQQVIFSAYNTAIQVYIQPSSNYLFYQIPSGGASGVITGAVTTYALSVNTWYYITITFQTNGICSMYVNNTLIGSASNVGGYGTFNVSQFSLGTFDTSTTQAFNGYIDDLRITNSVSTYVPIPLLQPNIWLPFENTAGDLGSYSLPPSVTPTIYLPFEGNVIDSMGFSTVTATGSVSYPSANREGYTGQALRLTNTAGTTATQYVKGSWTGAANFTISGWFNVVSFQTSPYASNNVHLFSAYSSVFGVYINPSNQLVANAPNVGAGSLVGTSSAISLNTWYYIQLIFRTGGLCEFYLNNVRIGTATNTGGPGSTTQFALGTLDNNTSNAFNGIIDDFRIYNDAIPYVPVSNTTVTGSLSYVPGVVGLNAVNLVNTVGSTATNYIRGAWTGSPNITVSGWFNVSSFHTSGGNVHLFFAYTGAFGVFFGLDQQIQYFIPNGGATAGVTIATSNKISLNTWYHIYCTFRTGGLCELYINGSLIGSATNTGGVGTLSTTQFAIGTLDSSTSGAFNGYVDDFRIYNAAIPIHVLFPQNYRSLALSGTGQYALASAASGWVVGSSDSLRTWEKEAVCVGTQSDFIQPNLSGLPVTATTWTQNGVTWTALASSDNGATQSVSRAFNNTVSSDAWLSNNTTQRYTAGSPNGNAASTNIQTIGATAGEWIQIESSVPMVLASFAFGIGLNAYPSSGTPKTYYIVGSNDNSTWVPLQFGNFTISAWTSTSSNITMNITGTQPFNGNMVGSVATTAYPSYTLNAYRYFRLIGTSLMIYGGSAGTTYMEVGEWFLNFVRPLTLSRPPTHALSMNHTGQYQLVATGPASGSIMPNQTGLAASTWTQGGVTWVASANTSAYPAHRAFNNLNASAADKWETTAGSYTGGSFSYAGTASTTIQTVGSVGGDWLQIQSSVPLVLASYSIGANDLIGRSPKTYYIVGSNDGNTWFPVQYCNFATIPFTTTFTTTSHIRVNISGIQSITAGQTVSATTTTYTFTTNAYLYFRIVTTHLFSEALINIGEWNLNFQNSVSYSSNYGATWLNTSPTVSNESVALSSSGQYALSTNSVAPFARLTLDNTNVDAQGVLGAPTVIGTSFSYDTNKVVGTHSINFANTAGATSGITYLNYTVPTTLNTPSALTISCWVYPTSFPVHPNAVTPVSFTNGATSGTVVGGPQFYFRSGSSGIAFNVNGATTQYAENGTTALSLNTWSHVCATYNGSTMVLYVNGIAIATSNSAGRLTLSNGSSITNLFIGTLSYNTYAFAGNVDDVRLYTSALNADEINGLFKNPALTQTVAVSSSYLPITSYTEPVLPGITANIVDAAVSQTGQYMVAVTSSTTNNVYYSTDFGATFTALTVGSSAMVSCSISYDGSYLTVESATTVHTLNRNTRGFSVTVGNQAGLINQAQNAIAIGDKAGRTNQSANSIVLNATGNALDAVAPGFYVAPIATAASSSAAPFSVLGYGTDSQIVQSSALTVLQNGNVGIGTTDPASVFHVNGNSIVANYKPYTFSNFTVTRSTAAASMAIVAGTESSIATLYLGTPHNPLFSTNSAYKVCILANGNGSGIGWSTADLHFCLNGTTGGSANDVVNTASITDSKMVIKCGGNVGIGVTNPLHRLHLDADSAAKPSTNTWIVSSDERLKENITLADIDRCVEIIRTVPLKHYRWRNEVYTIEQVKDRSKLGWIAQDVEKVFPKAVGTHIFRYNQVYEYVVKEDGSTEKQMVSEDVLDDCRDLNADQLYAVMYGAIQKLIVENDSQKATNHALMQKLDALSASHAALLTWAQTQGFTL